MAQITVIYKDFEEMKAVARELLRDELNENQSSEEKSVPYGQQIAPYFPNANVGQAPAGTPTAPSKPAAPTMPTAPTAPSEPVAPTMPSAPAIPTTNPSYTRDDLSRAAMTLMDKGMQGELQQLLQSYGVNSLVDLAPEQYGNFATALRGMGAQI